MHSASDSSIPWDTNLRHAKSIEYLPALAWSKLRYFGSRKRLASETAVLSNPEMSLKRG